MKLAWVGIALLASSWLLGLDYFHPAQWLPWAIVVIAGLGCLIGTIQFSVPRRLAILLLAMNAPAAFFATWPDRAASGLIAVGLCAHLLGGRWKFSQSLGSTVIVGGTILLAQSLAMDAYQSLTARSHELPDSLAWLLELIARLLGMNAAVDGTNLNIFAMRKMQPLGATWELLIDPLSVTFLAGAIILILCHHWSTLQRIRVKHCLKTLIVLAAIFLLWLPVRAGLMLAIYMHRILRTEYDEKLDVIGQFWNPWLALFMLIGPVLLAWRWIPEHPPQKEVASTPRGWIKPTWIGSLALLGTAAFTITLLGDPVGQRKQGRIVVDDYHSQLPWPGKEYDTTRSDRPFDTTWYARESEYNHSAIYDYCSRYYQITRQLKPLDERSLSECDVLVLKVPSGRYSDEEITSVQRFVERGGGLLLMGEHTSVFGSGVILNEISELFGFRFEYDCLFGMESFFDQRYVPPLVPHPAVRHMPPMEFAISCSIKPTTGSGRVVIGSTGLKSLEADYHALNYYPPAENQPQMRYGAFVQLWSTKWGDGRVLGFTDSTIFSNFSTFEGGKTELMLGMLEWLNHRDTGMNMRPWLGASGLILILASVLLALIWNRGWLVLLSAGLLGSTIGASALRAGYIDAMPLPEAAHPMVQVAIDRTVSEELLSKSGFLLGKGSGFGLFERSILRLGYFTYRASGSTAFDADLIVVLYPKRINQKFSGQLEKYVASGGKVLIVDSPMNSESTSDELLRPFGLSMDRSSIIKGQLSNSSGFPTLSIDNAYPIDGGVSFAYIQGSPVAVTKRHGEGSLTLISFGAKFNDKNMGDLGYANPDAAILTVYEFEYGLIKAIISNNFSQERDPKTEANVEDFPIPQ